MKKKTLGIYYTTINPFNPIPLNNWVSEIEKREDKKFSSLQFLEPFAGSNNIVDIINPLFQEDLNWKCYDIEPNNEDNTSGIPVIKRDTLKDFPKGDVIITNPPYLAKNRAKKLGLPFPFEAEKYIDLYLYALDVMLSNVKYVCAIIPNSFMQRISLFKQHIYAIDSISNKLFEDTDEPILVAYFIRDINREFTIYADGYMLGTYDELKSKLVISNIDVPMQFNHPEGEIGLIAIDSTKGESIRFCRGEELKDRKINNSSRSYTRIKISIDNVDNVIKKANQILQKFREDTYDLFLTAFKGMMKTGKLRRRLDYKMARNILNLAIEQIKGGK